VPPRISLEEVDILEPADPVKRRSYVTWLRIIRWTFHFEAAQFGLTVDSDNVALRGKEDVALTIGETSWLASGLEVTNLVAILTLRSRLKFKNSKPTLPALM